ALKLTNTSVGPFEGFVLHQYGLDQRVDGVGGLPQAIPDKPFGLGIALGILQHGQAVEQFDDEIAFLWSHWSPPSSLRRESCRQMPVKAECPAPTKPVSVLFPSLDQWEGRGGDAVAAPKRACSPHPRVTAILASAVSAKVLHARQASERRRWSYAGEGR